MRLTTEQLSIIHNQCKKWVNTPIALSRRRSANNIRLFAIHKVRWGGGSAVLDHYKQTVSPIVEHALSSALGSTHVIDKTIVVDWQDSVDDGEWIIPVGDSWQCYPLALLRLSGDNRQLISECISVALDGINSNVQSGVSEKIDVGIIGVKRFITIKRRGYKTISHLIADIRKYCNE